METKEMLINFVAVVLAWMIMFVSDKRSRRAISEEEIDEYQARLKEIDRELKEKYGLSLKRDAKEEIQRNRRDGQGFTLIFGGIFLGIAAIILLITELIGIGNMMVAMVSAIWLIFYGLSRFTQHLKVLFLLLALMVVAGIILLVIIDQILLVYPGSFFFLLLSLLLYFLIRSRRKGQGK